MPASPPCVCKSAEPALNPVLSCKSCLKKCFVGRNDVIFSPDSHSENNALQILRCAQNDNVVMGNRAPYGTIIPYRFTKLPS